MRKTNSNYRNIMLISAETIITSALLSVPIMTPFFLSLGLNQEKIALSQMIFTGVVIILNVPLGYVADCFGRKEANVIGDLICTISLLLYSQAQGFWHVVGCEILFGIGVSFSQGVDSSLLKHFCDKEDESGWLFHDYFARTSMGCQIFTFITMLLGGPIGAISFRLAVGLSSVVMLIGTGLSLCIEDDSPKLERNNGGTLSQISEIIREMVANPELRLSIAAYALARECTHGIIWVFTPLMLAVGIPLSVVSVGWAINYVAATFGSYLVKRFAKNMREWQIIAMPVMAVIISSSIMFFSLNYVTIWLYAVFGMAQGWTAASAMPLIKRRAEPEKQASVESFARVCAQLLYVGAVWVINRAADYGLVYAFLATILIFAPLSVLVIVPLWRKEKRT